ncbi:MAG: hypothetical protein AUJ58_05255 [Zetaproteobacteria bacterium CG1_02_55_237]|nr:MAG: hypothetical protein AUJ58_05255 [Zetaproteobacteria bacterium CG1_02_55_237]
MTGNVQLAQALTLTGNLTVAGSGLSGVLAVNGQTLSISGTLTSWSTNAASGLKMVNAADVVTVGGSATFRDGSNANTSGWFTAGALHVHGNFSEIDGNNSTFIATGTHKVVFDGAAAQTISFIHPGTSYFNDVEIANNVSLASNILIKGVGIIGAGVTPTITGNGRTVTAAGGTSIDGAIFDHVLLIASGAALGGKFDNVTFRNYAATDTQMTIALANTTFTPFNNLQFLSTPTTGKYISITTTGTTVTLAGAGTKPLYGIPKTSVVPGSTLNWGATADDSDGDGLTDSDELNTYGTDPNNADTDGDGLSDGAEVTAGTNPLLADTDGDGVGDGIEVFRGQNPLVANTVYFVDGTKPDDTGVGTSWATAKKTLSAAITAAPNGATASTATYILVAAGTYAPITITGRSNLQLVGSVSSTVLNPVDPLSSTIAVTTSGRPVMIDGNSTSIHLTGFIITGGNSSLGGGVRFDLSDGGIHLCNIKGNSSTNDAGGVYLNNSLRSKVVIDQKTTISGNIAVNSGGGIFAKGSFDMVETVVVNNTANGAAASSMGGGGLLLAPASASDAILIKNSVIAGNDASAGYGGGIYVRQPANLVTIFNNLISGNRAATAGGGIKLHDPRNSVVSSNTIAYNQVGSASSGGGITYFESGLSNGQIPSIHDNILWFNEDNTVEATINVGESLNDPLTIGNAITSAMSFNNDIGQGVVNNASDISINPNFQSGFYLDQTLTAPNGPIDAGSAATASSVFANGETTNVTGAADAGVLDMGGHYLKAYGFTGTASATVTPVATIVGNTTLQEVKIKPAIGGLNLGPGQSVFVQSGAGSTTGVTLSSLTGIQPSGAGSVLARDNGDGNYSVFVDTTGVATGSLILDVNESGSVLTGAATLSW